MEINDIIRIAVTLFILGIVWYAVHKMNKDDYSENQY